MQRLTTSINGNVCYSKCSLDDVLEKLYEYENAEEQGLLLRLPCKVGDNVYQIVKSLSYGEVGDPAQVNYRISEIKFHLCMVDLIGVIVFLTKEEAEQKLKELIKG